MAWDVFGTGKTSVKWNMGKYLAAAGINGIYADANPARRTRATITRVPGPMATAIASSIATC